MSSEAVEQKSGIRNSNLELLRIVSMVLIVMSHSDDWMGLASTYQNAVGINRLITDWLHLGGQVGVGCFLLISGYFMVEQRFSFKKILRLLGEVWFYSVGVWAVYVVAALINKTSLAASVVFKLAVKAFFPVVFSHYWFVTAYVILMILSPFFNKLIEAMDKRTYQLLLAALIVLFVVIEGGVPKALYGMAQGRLMPVFIMYFVAGYIKKHVNNNIDNSSKHLIVGVAGYLFLFATVIVIEQIGYALNNETIMGACYFLRPLNSPVVLLINVELFLAFLRMKPRHNKVINTIASCTLGVYLLHGNEIIAGTVLPKIFPVYKETDSLRLFLYSVGAVAVVYVTCTIVDLIRQKNLEKLWVKMLNKHYDSWEEKVKQLFFTAGEKVSVLGKRFYK